MTEREIFLEALEVATPEARVAYLQAACGSDVTLRRKVEELLREHFANDSLLAGPAVEGKPTAVPELPVKEVPAQMIGRYKLLERIGEGGFGEVWMAEQREPVKRRVALKIIKLGMDSRQVVARFEAERQALAMMDHPNIARIFDAGTIGSAESEVSNSKSQIQGGRPYFVMELVRGIKITEYCDQNQLPTRERLNLFILVCQAIQHAHQKGIIHRDIKPSNILVTLHDGVPVPKVIDFGIAKATQQELTDKTVFTQFQQFIGTPAYISPEQAEMSGLDIDTRADIYSLGVLLYELLVGQTPFDAKEMVQGGIDALRRMIREREPLRPSTKLSQTLVAADVRRLSSKSEIQNPKSEIDGASSRRLLRSKETVTLLRGDLDWIVMKCLEKDRTRRYETANGLAADIQRHLANEPVIARPPSAGYRLRKFVRRNKGTVLVAALILMSLVVGIIGTTERNRALQAVNERERLLNERARQVIETLTSDTAIEQLTREKELRPEQREFLGKMIQYYAESTKDAVATEEERSRQARAFVRLGRLNRVLGRAQDSEIAYRRAVALGRQLAADFPNRPEFRMELASSHNSLGVLLSANGRRQEAELVYLESLTMVKKLAADFPMRREFRQALAGIHHNLGNLLHVIGRPKEAEVAHDEAFAIRKQLAVDFPAETILRRALAMSHNSLGWLYQNTKRFEKAEPAFRDAVALQKQVVVDFPNQPEFRLELAKSLHNLGNLLRDTDRPKDAEAAYAEALVIFKQLVADYPNRPEFRQEMVERGLYEGGRETETRVNKYQSAKSVGNSDSPQKQEQ